MKALDRLLQSWRISVARPFIPSGARVLDVGCSDGELFRQLGSSLGEGVGIDADLDEPVVGPDFELIPGTFPESLGDRPSFDVITMLAVLEHVPRDRQADVASACSRYLKPSGHLVITTPAPAVDRILDVLLFLRLIDGMSLEQHYGFHPSDTPGIFSPHNLTLVTFRRFQLGLNNLFVFQKGI